MPLFTSRVGPKGADGAPGPAGASPSGRAWWLKEVASDIPGYFQAFETDEALGFGADQAAICLAPGVEYLVADFATDEGAPGVRVIPPGTWRVVVLGYVTQAGDLPPDADSYFVFSIYQREAGGAEHLLARWESDYFSGDAPVTITQDIPAPGRTLNIGDRLVLRVNAVTESSNPAAVHLCWGGVGGYKIARFVSPIFEGSRGSPGNDGPEGPAGADGATGATGPTGPANGYWRYHHQSLGPLAHWRFNGSAFDSSGNNFHLTRFGGTEQYTEAAPGILGAYFDGATSFNRAIEAMLQITGDITLMGIVRLEEYPASAARVLAICAAAGETEETNALWGMWGLNVPNQNVNFAAIWETGAGVNVFPSSDLILPLFRPVHLAIVRSGVTPNVTCRFYVNGVLVKTVPGLTAPTKGAAPQQAMWVGSSEGGAGQFWKGALASLVVYSTAFSDAQIAAQYAYVAQGGPIPA